MSDTIQSKLGKTYVRSDIDEAALLSEINTLKKQGANSRCAECSATPTAWASVSLGVFICTKCAQVHRSLGAHISKVKSCMGTYEWCPDEVAAMKAVGNEKANQIYGVAPPPVKPLDHSMGGDLFNRAKNRYEKKMYASATPPAQKSAPPPTQQSGGIVWECKDEDW
eukprot:TRINITY_DN649_c0_g3_i1.p1 TRINITY_DN649_c0_g3~~TRINITY_DN649_c0_g3_i1.p1  ORF type:complete len:167 (+),score=29.22 TRINITY_DN649_c0_g3_i1:77-577(+)